METTRIEYGTTQGKKGQKLPRINLGFSTDNHEYLKKESRRQGLSITAFINQILDERRKTMNAESCPNTGAELESNTENEQ